MASKTKKPRIEWIEGLLTFYEAKFPLDAKDPRKLGFSVGRQIIGLYVIEMLLKYALDNAGVSHGQHHNLQQLFRNLSRQRRRAVERKYKEILNSEVQRTWDVAKTAESFLKYLGENAITDTRYFWGGLPQNLWVERRAGSPRQTHSVPVCSPPSRRVAPLRPRCAGLTAWTPAARTSVPALV